MRSSVKAGFFITLILIFLGSGEIYSQSGPGSPYSFFGIGTINEGGTGINKILGGSGIGVRDSLSLNLKNPAAYSAIHPAFTQVTASGFDFNLLNLKTDQGRSLYTDFLFSGINLWVRPFNKAGVNLGIMPYSVVRYDIKSVNTLYGLPGEYTVNYKGSGGITRLYFGAGYEIVRNLSLGANVSYYFGAINHDRDVSTSDNLNNFSIVEKTYLHAINFDYGLQYRINMGRNKLMLGLTYQGEKQFRGKYNFSISSTADTLAQALPEVTNYYLPSLYGGGIEFLIHDRLLFTGEYQLGRWRSQTLTSGYTIGDGSRISFGLMKLVQPTVESPFQVQSFGLGGYYQQNYLQFNGNPINEFGISAGIRVMTLGRSMLEFTYQTSFKGYDLGAQIQESRNRISLSFSLFDIWFIRRKIE